MTHIYNIMLMTYKEKSRHSSFLFLIFAVVMLSYYCIPDTMDSLVILCIEMDKFIQGGNPTWIPITSAMGIAILLPFIGFFYFRTDLIVEHRQGFVQLFSTTTTTKFQYLIGKYFAHLILLYQIIVVVSIATFMILQILYPNSGIGVWQFVSPFIAVSIGSLLLASLPIIFDSISFLRGIFGSIIYVEYVFFMSGAMQSVNGVSTYSPVEMFIYANNLSKDLVMKFLRLFDVTGSALLNNQMGIDVFEQSKEVLSDIRILAVREPHIIVTEQLYLNEITLILTDIFLIMGTILISFIMLYISSMCIGSKFKTIKYTNEVVDSDFKFAREKMNINSIVRKPNILTQLQLEIKLIWTTIPKFWRNILKIIFILGYVNNLEVMQSQMVLPLIMVIFVKCLSTSSCRDYLFGTYPIVGSVLGGKLHFIGIRWFANFIIINIVLSGIIFRTAGVGQGLALFSYFSGLIFMLSIATFFGEFTQRETFFECIFLILTYASINTIDWAIFITLDQNYLSNTRSLIYLCLGILGIILVIIKEKVWKF